MAEVSSHLSVRLDDETRAALARYTEANEMKVSQAVRVLLALALREEGASGDETFRRAAFREGIQAGVATIKEKFTSSVALAVTAALGEMDDL